MKNEPDDLELGEPGSPDVEERVVPVPGAFDELGLERITIRAESLEAAHQWDARMWRR